MLSLPDPNGDEDGVNPDLPIWNDECGAGRGVLTKKASTTLELTSNGESRDSLIVRK